MKNVLLQRAVKLNKNRRLRKGWQIVVRTLAAGVVFCTTYVLILPAITMQEAPICGYDEHIHSDACYVQPQAKLTNCGIGADAVVIHQHSDLCCDEAGNLICALPEQSVHIHDDSCHQQEAVLACVVTHVHSDACVQTETTQICTLEESEEHAHTEDCYTVTEVPCAEQTADDHSHEDACWQQVEKLVCGKQELQLHSHDEACYDAEGNLICNLPVVVEHVHSVTCLAVPESAQPQLQCTLEEHTHTDACYPLEEDVQLSAEHHCGYAAHTHVETCYDTEGNLTCTIPEHIHEAACLVEDLDLTADKEWPASWAAQKEKLTFTGVWAEDLLTMAKSQLGYAESKRNCILKNDQLLGYTRYADWYGEDYGQWDDMFVSFCLHYAEIPAETLPYESDTARWIELLIAKEMYNPAGTYTPVSGDLVFWDSDADGQADKSGIVVEITDEKVIRMIAGDTENNLVEILTFRAEDAAKITGYCPLPTNPMSPEQWQEAEAVKLLMAQLPEAQKLRDALQKLNADGDKAGYEALRQEATARVEAAENAYNALNDAQKARVAGLERLTELKEVCGGESWKQFAVLTDDGAALIQLTADNAQITRAESLAEEDAPASVIPDNAVQNQDTIHYAFTATAESYYTDVYYGEAAVKVELVLPLTEDKAVFDIEAMTWLEDGILTTETRLINEIETPCQVLTGYKILRATATSGIVVPGSFTETVPVTVLDLAHGEQIALIISAAMEHNTWDGICEAHQTEEKLTVVTESYTGYLPQDDQTQQANYEAFLKEANEIKEQELSDSDQYFAAQGLMRRIAECYNAGGLADAQFEELSELIAELSDVNLNTIAEPCIGNNWMKIDFSEDVIYSEESVSLDGYAQAYSIRSAPAMSASVYSEVFPSAKQIKNEGGSNVSQDGAVMVSKTIEGTDVENVFDITLRVVTQDEVNEVYKDPNMAVVVVMDISNTMRSNFGDTTRYSAAMAAGENFLKKFAEQNSTLSRVGYVAFNTSAHEVFDLSPCNTTAQATSLTNTMKTKTGNIINATDYSSSKTRFTNMEAGLKMASDMLAEADNQHKYIIFISDGFPTTYLKSGTTGYEPFSSSGTKGNDGVFYDSLLTYKSGSKTLSKYCMYGTSYSDTAAIKARQLAVNLKSQGVNIFSIGVDVGGQTLWNYHNQSVNADNFSVVERRQNLNYYRTTGYEIGTKHGEIDKTSVTTEEKTAMAQDFKDWLKGSATTGIGSGYYYDSTNLSGLNAAYDTIFQKILELNASSSHLDWVAADPMPDMGIHEVKAMEFVSFWDLNENGEWVLVADNLTGVSKDGNLYDNTADFHEDTQTIHWDIKKSGYVSQSYGNTTNYACELKYRVRLKNESQEFEEGQIYDTNDVTTLTYRIIEVVDNQTNISERRTINFPIPAVEGYLSELNFKKVNAAGEPLGDAEFLLQHDSSCNICRGDGATAVTVADMTAKSDHTGMVTFERIPSGHIYMLTETHAPDGFIKTDNQYKVVVSYDQQTVTVLDKDGKELELTWDADNPTIENDMYYALPETGGMGTSHFTFGGLLLITVSLMNICITGRKRQKGGR